MTGGDDDTASAETLVRDSSAGTASSSSPDGAASHPGSMVSDELVAQRYTIVNLLGRGGMGAVYRARDAELDEIVALKVLNAELAASPMLIERFRREVKLARRVTHPNVARMYDIGEHQGVKFLTMEFVAGKSLGEILDAKGRLSPQRVIDISGALCAGLSAAHRAGVVHRDLKPDNVMIGDDGRVVITDFGIARDPLAGAAGHTMGAVVGTPAYMAPEQVEGAPTIDGRADIYALGVMLFELLTGELPFHGTSAMTMAAARLSAAPPDPRSIRSELSPQLAQIVLRCLERQPDARFSDPLEVASALASASATLPQGHAPAISSPVGHRIAPQLNEKRLAVLPLTNHGPSEDAYLADGLTEDLIDTLSMTAGLRVRPRGAVDGLDPTLRDPRDIGRELEVDVVVSGSVRRADDRVRLTVRLISVDDGFQLWAQRFERPMSELLVVSDETARAIADALTVQADQKHAAPNDPAVVDLYLQARAALHAGIRGSIDRSMELFRQAHERAPDDVAILSGYARACARQWYFSGAEAGAADEARRLSERAALRAPGDPEALLALANVRLLDGHLREAGEASRKAFLRAPANSDVRELYARLLLEVNMPEEAIEHLEGIARFEPMRSCRLDLIRAHAMLGHHQRALDLFAQNQAAADQSPGEVVLRTRLALWSPALRPLLTSYELDNIPDVPPWTLSLAVRELLLGGDVEAELAELRRGAEHARGAARFLVLMRQVVIEIDTFRGLHDSALEQLERATEGGLFDLSWFERCPVLEPLRTDPRFIAARARIAARASVLREGLGVPHHG